MKRIFTSLLLTAMLFLAGSSLAQTTHPWELGFNGGAAWQQSDVKMKKLGGGLGFTLGQMYCQTPTSPLDWGWRFRFLSANTYGQETKRHYGIQNNLVLNGGLDDSLNYYSNPGYVYHNYKTTLSELSLEVLIGLNRMRERTKVYPYIFGGVGITKGTAKIDQFDANNRMYDYALLDSANASSQLGSLLDNNYETLADGNTSPRWKFMPSLGVGLGFQLTKGFSIGLEHKVTWALNDVLDGQQWSNTNAATGNNDKYHYSSLWLKFSFGRTAKPTSTNTTNVTNYTNNNTVVATTPEKPNITLTAPASGSATVSQQTYTVTARITNINSISDIVFTANGAGITNFTYNAGSQIFSAPVMLINGSNNYVITATNAVGSATANASIVYNMPPPPQQLAPVVSITNPNINPYTTNDAVIGVGGTVMNINDRNQMQVSVNGAPNNSFTYSPATKAFMINAALVLGANTFVISATNPNGSDSKSTVVIYQQSAAVFTGPPPVITITNPSANPYNTALNSASVTATVTNVTASSQITVSLNGNNVPFTFNAGTHQLALNVALITGANTVTISATNPNGSDTKSRTIVYAPVVSPKPVVTITNPGVNPYNSIVNVVPVNATVLNVTAVGQIAVSVNGSNLPTGALSFNAGTAQLSFNANLIAGANSVQVTASNVAGSDSKSTTIIYTQPVSLPAPVVTITNPAVNPYNTTSNAITINATVLNVTTASQILVSFNGSSTPFSFNPTTHQLTLNATLIAGANTVSVTATNSVGSDSKAITIIYTAPVTLPAPVVTITSPTVNPYTTTLNTVPVNATVLNVSTAAQVTVKLNGTNVPFNFNPVTHLLDLNASLILGANTVTVSATNPVGSDSKSITIIYSQPAAAPAPVVTITNPAVNPFNTAVNAATVNATVLNVTTSSQITVKLNGTSTSSFSFNAATHQLVFNASLIAGSNTVSISATNSSGTDSKSTVIIYTAPAPMLPPVVTITSPNANPFMHNALSYTVKATVLNVTGASQIQVFLDATPITAFTYSVSTKVLTYNATLHAGANSIKIVATNAAGSDTKSVTIKVLATSGGTGADTPTNEPGKPLKGGPGGGLGGASGATSGAGSIGMTGATASTPASSGPAITLVTPSGTSVTTTDVVYTVVATVDVPNQMNIAVKVNGTATSTFSFNRASKTLSIPLTLTAGNTTVVIEATNGGSSNSKTITITKP